MNKDTMKKLAYESKAQQECHEQQWREQEWRELEADEVLNWELWCKECESE